MQDGCLIPQSGLDFCHSSYYLVTNYSRLNMMKCDSLERQQRGSMFMQINGSGTIPECREIYITLSPKVILLAISIAACDEINQVFSA